jgi:feruloyl esterase
MLTCWRAILSVPILTAATVLSAREPRAPAAATCESLAALKLPQTTIAVAAPVAVGQFQPPTGQSIRVPAAACRVTGSIKPSSDSDIRFEVWMPASDWNGKMQGIGNGGFAGDIWFGSLAALSAQGYAAVSTDTGHAANALDASWALGHPEKVIDFGHRAIHEAAVAAKAIIEAFYGNRPSRAYFASCSNGGRQALMEAQRYPDDYDGILAGAPANYWTHNLTVGLADFAIQSDPARSLSPAKLAAIEAEALAACDADDGVQDEVIENPAHCKFNPSALLCPGTETNACLTAGQIEGLKKMLAGPQLSSGKTIFPGHAVGGMTGADGWPGWITGSGSGARGAGPTLGIGFYTNMVFERADWDPRTFSIDRDLKVADEKLAATLNATDPDLSRFSRRGGKLIVYHGWSDAAIAPANAIDYYNSVAARMGTASTGSFMRLYMVPGMQHCADGPGVTNFGQVGPAPADRAHNILTALRAWVEDNVAPQEIIATKYRPGSTTEVVRTRPICPYPQVARWNGAGSTDDAANFTCR